MLFVAAALVGLVVLWRQGALGDVGSAVRSADPFLVVAGFLLYLLGLALLSSRWHLLVILTHGRSDPARAAEAFLTSVVINYAAPIGLAVPARAALTKRALGLSVAETGAVAFWEIVADVLVLGAIAAVWLLLVLGRASVVVDAVGPAGPWVAGAMVGSGVVAATVALGVGPVRRRVAKVAGGAWGYPRRRPGLAGVILAVTAAYWVAQAITLAIFLVAFGVGVSPVLLTGLTGLPVLAGMLSPVPGGAGVREALMVAVARVHGADEAAVLVAALAYRVALFAAIPVLYGLVRLWLVRRASSPAGPTRIPS
ncbi:MAG: flippase-like domain-containing protein [Chloroflexota bacterium]|nr:flippase-like domain-containing protein [Chloroflexota bacterium]